MNNRKASLLMYFLKVNALQNVSKCCIACNLMVFENIFKEFLSTTTIFQAIKQERYKGENLPSAGETCVSGP